MNALKLFRLVMVGAFGLVMVNAGAQDYPSKPVRMIMPYPVGGPLDVIGRIVSDRLTRSLGHAFLIESRPGAGGNLGTEQVARAAPDGYTLLLAVNFTLTSNLHLYEKLPFDPLKDFAPVIAMAGVDRVLITHPSVPARNVKELIAHLKANPGKLNFASGGKGSPGHVLGELCKLKTGTDLVHVPYKGNAPAVQSVVAGETAIMLTPTTVVTPHIKAGRLRALAVYNTDRNDDFPDVPSLDREGISGFDQKSLPGWFGILAPAATPRDVVRKLNVEINRILRERDVVPLLHASRFIVIGGTSEEFGTLLRTTYDAWGKVIRDTGIKGE